MSSEPAPVAIERGPLRSQTHGLVRAQVPDAGQSLVSADERPSSAPARGRGRGRGNDRGRGRGRGNNRGRGRGRDRGRGRPRPPDDAGRHAEEPSGEEAGRNARTGDHGEDGNRLRDGASAESLAPGTAQEETRPSGNIARRAPNNRHRHRPRIVDGRGAVSANGSTPAARPHRKTGDASAMLVDISDRSSVTDGFASEATELAEKLSKLMRQGHVECVVCLDRIRRDRYTWSCQTCYAIVHLSCARKWGREAEDGAGNALGFRCPSCRTSSCSLKDLAEYRCYCGRVRNPPLEPGLVPGSCGEPCLRPLGAPTSGCPHRCENMLCHPGPCPPCMRPGEDVTCHCGAERIKRRCGDAIDPNGVSCGRPCKRRLSCGHQCQSKCHRGACGECLESVTVKCFCGQSETALPCAYAQPFSCGNVCNKLLECGVHRCTRTCHEGPCGLCAADPSVVTTCPCGKRRLTDLEMRMRTSCVDDVPSCGSPCGQGLGCLGGHKCEQLCGHEGACKPCGRTVEALCRCGAQVVKVSCRPLDASLLDELTCDTPCGERLSCKRADHRCTRVCCEFRKPKALQRDGVIVTTDLILGTQDLSQRAKAARRREGHKCVEICAQQLSCGVDGHLCDAVCGHAGECPPCGRLVREPLSCACGAETVQGPYRCGTPPPPCSRPCPRPRAGCSHPCPDRCDHVGPCPPCVELVRLQCVGGHGENRVVPCHVGAPRGITCHRPCGAALKCGNHACRLGCHDNVPESCEESSADGCTQICGLPRACGHGCAYACHPNSSCPATPCKAEVLVTCPCKRREELAPCLRGGAVGSTPLGATGSIRLTCDEECESEQRLRAFASAIGATTEQLAAIREVRPMDGIRVGEDGRVTYEPFMLDFASREPTALAFIEKQLMEIVNGKSRKVDLGALPRVHAMVARRLAELFLLEPMSSRKNGAVHVVVQHKGAGAKPFAPVPMLSEARAAALSVRTLSARPEARTLILFVHAGVVDRDGREQTLRERCKAVLKPQTGYYTLHEEAPMTNGGRMGMRVEFSTKERMEVARASLVARPDCVTAELTEDTECVASNAASTWDDDRPRADHAYGAATAGAVEPREYMPRARAVDSHVLDSSVPDSWEDA